MDTPLKDPARAKRLDGIFEGMSKALFPCETRSIACEWEDEEHNLTGYLFVSGIYERIEFDADMSLRDEQLAQRMADAALPIVLERLGLDRAKERGDPFTDLVRIHDIHRQLLDNAKVDLHSYLDRIGNEKYVHHQPSYSNGDYFVVPSLSGDIERLPQGFGDIVLDGAMRLNVALTLTISDDIKLWVTKDGSEFRIEGQLPSVVTETLIGRDFFEVFEVEALAGAKAMVTRVDMSPATTMRPATHYIGIEHKMRYVNDPIWDEKLEQEVRERLSRWVKKES